MQVNRIILKPGRALTDEEIKTLERKMLVFQTIRKETGPQIDRFAGANIPSKLRGVYDSVWCLLCNVNSIAKNEFELVFEDTEHVNALDRIQSGGQLSGYNMEPIENQIEYLKQTPFSVYMSDENIIDQIKQKYAEEGKSDYFSTHYFRYSDQRENFFEETMDLLSNMNLRAQSLVEVTEKDDSKKLYNVVIDGKQKKYMFVEFPCRMSFWYMGKMLQYYKTVSLDKRVPEESQEDLLNKAAKLHTIEQLVSSSLLNNCYDSVFIMPEVISSEEEFVALKNMVEQIEIPVLDINTISVEEIDGLIRQPASKAVFEALFKNKDTNDVLSSINNAKDNELKKVLMESFSKKDEEYTREQIESIKKLLEELLSDENGWEDNANIIGRYASRIGKVFDFEDKMSLLQMSISANNRYSEKTFLNSNFYDKEEQIQLGKSQMSLQKLINSLFTKEEQDALVSELIKHKNYQAMVMILNECVFKNKQSNTDYEEDKYINMSTTQKNNMAEALVESVEDESNDWQTWAKRKVKYIWEYKQYKEQQLKLAALEDLIGDSIVYAVPLEYSGIIKGENKDIECFRSYDNAFYLRVENAKSKIQNGRLIIKLNKELHGKMIGKKGCNIKRIQEELSNMIYENNGKSVRISIQEGDEKDNTKDKKITLAQIENAIERRKSLALDAM